MPNRTDESIAAQAAAFLAVSAGAVGGFNGIQSQIDREAACLIEWARKRGLLLTDSCTDGLERLNRESAEHAVYFRVLDRRVVKCTFPGKFGLGHGPVGKHGRHPAATPFFYLQRMDLMNQEFPIDWRLEGIALGTQNTETKDHKPYLVTSQSYIEMADVNHPHPSESEISDLMVGLGFELLADSVYNWFRKSDEIIVTDAKELNFIVSPQGIVPIDLIIGRLHRVSEA